MDLELRKFTKFVDKTFIEGGKKAKEPVLLVSVAAVFKNPWARRLNRRNNLACGRINFIKGGKLAWRLFAIDDGPDSFNWHREAP